MAADARDMVIPRQSIYSRRITTRRPKLGHCSHRLIVYSPICVALMGHAGRWSAALPGLPACLPACSQSVAIDLCTPTSCSHCCAPLPYHAQRIVVKNCIVSLSLEDMSQELVFDDSHGGASLTTVLTKWFHYYTAQSNNSCF